MAINKESTAAKSPVPGDWLADIRSLAKLLRQYELTQLEVELGGGKIVLRRDLTAPSGGMPTAMVALPAAAQQTVEGHHVEMAAAATASNAAVRGTLVTSPFVGTFYRAPSPEAAVFVEVGQQVRKGQTLCIIEAMKLMNEIEADADCKVLEVLAGNGDAVEYGQPLFRVEHR